MRERNKTMGKKKKNYLRPKSKIKYFLFLCLFFFLFPFVKLLYGRKHNWLICDRGTEAQDNGYFFFKYLRKNHPEINAVFLIKKNSPDFQKVSSLGKVVEFGSIKHFLMALGFSVKISSHLYGYAPWIQMALFYRRNKTHDTHVFLQHGITKNFIPGFLSKNCNSLKLFICGAKPEYDYLVSYFGYKKTVVQYTGFSRFDSLEDVKTDNRILIMPTWRRYLEKLTEMDFLNSKFYKSWNELLCDNNLLRVLHDNNIKIDLYLHSSLQKYSDCFASSDVINVIHFNEKDVQTLLKEDSLLVTDFSSVFFDFAYMRKPIVFYQFDEEQYYDGHYDKGYFDYRKDGFGHVCLTKDSLTNAIVKLIKNGYRVETKFNKKIDEFFIYRDHLNSQRIFKAITKSND